MTTRYAPWVNLVSSTITRTTAVAIAPTPLIAAETRCLPVQPCSVATRRQYTTMPVWLSVKDTKTPRMYSWIRRVTEPSNATISAIATPDRMRMPLLNASRSPRRVSCLGRKRSSARIEARIGKPLNAVFAAIARMSVVEIWTAKKPTELLPKIAEES